MAKKGKKLIKRIHNKIDKANLSRPRLASKHNDLDKFIYDVLNQFFKAYTSIESIRDNNFLTLLLNTILSNISEKINEISLDSNISDVKSQIINQVLLYTENKIKDLSKNSQISSNNSNNSNNTIFTNTVNDDNIDPKQILNEIFNDAAINEFKLTIKNYFDTVNSNLSNNTDNINTADNTKKTDDKSNKSDKSDKLLNSKTDNSSYNKNIINIFKEEFEKEKTLNEHSFSQFNQNFNNKLIDISKLVSNINVKLKEITNTNIINKPKTIFKNIFSKKHYKRKSIFIDTKISEIFQKLDSTLLENITRSNIKLVDGFKKSRIAFLKQYKNTLRNVVLISNYVAQKNNVNTNSTNKQSVKYTNPNSVINETIPRIDNAQTSINKNVTRAGNNLSDDIYTQNGFIEEKKSKLGSALTWMGKTFLKFTIFLPFTVFKGYFTAFFKKNKTKKEKFVSTFLELMLLNRDFLFWTTAIVTSVIKNVWVKAAEKIIESPITGGITSIMKWVLKLGAKLITCVLKLAVSVIESILPKTWNAAKRIFAAIKDFTIFFTSPVWKNISDALFFILATIELAYSTSVSKVIMDATSGIANALFIGGKYSPYKNLIIYSWASRLIGLLIACAIGGISKLFTPTHKDKAYLNIVEKYKKYRGGTDPKEAVANMGLSYSILHENSNIVDMTNNFSRMVGAAATFNGGETETGSLNFFRAKYLKQHTNTFTDNNDLLHAVFDLNIAITDDNLTELSNKYINRFKTWFSFNNDINKNKSREELIDNQFNMISNFIKCKSSILEILALPLSDYFVLKQLEIPKNQIDLNNYIFKIYQDKFNGDWAKNFNPKTFSVSLEKLNGFITKLKKNAYDYRKTTYWLPQIKVQDIPNFYTPEYTNIPQGGRDFTGYLISAPYTNIFKEKIGTISDNFDLSNNNPYGIRTDKIPFNFTHLHGEQGLADYIKELGCSIQFSLIDGLRYIMDTNATFNNLESLKILDNPDLLKDKEILNNFKTSNPSTDNWIAQTLLELIEVYINNAN